MDQGYALIQTLTGNGKKPPEVSIGQCYDSLSSPPHDIQFVPITAIKSVAYVLPLINYDDKENDQESRKYALRQKKTGFQDYLLVLNYKIHHH